MGRAPHRFRTGVSVTNPSAAFVPVLLKTNVGITNVEPLSSACKALKRLKVTCTEPKFSLCSKSAPFDLRTRTPRSCTKDNAQLHQTTLSLIKPDERDLCLPGFILLIRRLASGFGNVEFLRRDTGDLNPIDKEGRSGR